MAKAKRNARFDVISKLFMGFQSGKQPLEVIKQNLTYLEYYLTEAELPKFAEQHPDIEMEAFTDFLKQTDALKTAKKRASTATGESRTHLDSVEAAEERGVAPENVEAYIAGVNAVYALVKELNGYVTKARVSFAVPVIKEKVAETTDSAVTEG